MQFLVSISCLLFCPDFGALTVVHVTAIFHPSIYLSIKPFIHFLHRLFYWVPKDLEPIPKDSGHKADFTHCGQIRDTNQPKMQVYGIVKKNGIAEQTPHTHGEAEWNPQPQRCEAKSILQNFKKFIQRHPVLLCCQPCKNNSSQYSTTISLVQFGGHDKTLFFGCLCFFQFILLHVMDLLSCCWLKSCIIYQRPKFSSEIYLKQCQTDKKNRQEVRQSINNFKGKSNFQKEKKQGKKKNTGKHGLVTHLTLLFNWVNIQVLYIECERNC